MPRNNVDIIGRNTDRLIKQYELIPTIISVGSLILGILIFAIPVCMDHFKKMNS